MKSLLRRLAVVTALAVLGSCLWRPPVIPPLAQPDGGSMSNRDASTGLTDATVMPSQDSGAPLTDQEACDNAARANDGSAPASVFNGGRVVTCGSAPADASINDAGSLADSGDASVSDAASEASSDAESRSDAAVDDAREDASASDAEDAG